MTVNELIEILSDTVKDFPRLGELEVRYCIPKSKEKDGLTSIFTYSIEEISMVGTSEHKFAAFILPTVDEIIYNYTKSVEKPEHIN